MAHKHVLPSPTPLLIAVGTSNELKIHAVASCFTERQDNTVTGAAVVGDKSEHDNGPNATQPNSDSHAASRRVRAVGLQDFQSVVDEWPIGKQVTLRGAEHRARAALEKHPSASIAVGIESGFEPRKSDNEPWIVFIAAVCLIPANHNVGTGNNSISKLVGWSPPLCCPITAQQRIEQVRSAVQACGGQLELAGGPLPRKNQKPSDQAID